jgi:hypothetical protein
MNRDRRPVIADPDAASVPAPPIAPRFAAPTPPLPGSVLPPPPAPALTTPFPPATVGVAWAPRDGAAADSLRWRPRKRSHGWLPRMTRVLAPPKRARGSSAVLASTPPWLISLLFHTALLLILGLWWFPDVHSNVLQLTLNFAETIGDQLQVEAVEIGAETEEVDQPVFTPDDLPQVAEPLLAPPTPPIAVVGPTAGSELTIPDVGMALDGRDAGMKPVLLAAYGGNALTEQAVADGLEWLKRNQLKDGTWSLAGPYADGAHNQNPTAATAMALLAFLGAGHTHQSGAHADVVQRGSQALLKMQGREGDFWKGTVGHHRLYSQAQAMIAICELYGMTQDAQLRSAAERSVAYAVKSQDSLGGWRYQPGFDSDTSVSGWFMMGLQSARMAQLEVPDETLDRLSRYLDRAASADGARYGYQPGMEPTFVMTAEALLCRQYLGWPRDDPRLQRGANLLLAHPIDWNERDVYYWYYATQVLHHLSGDVWDQWNRVMRRVLPEHQTHRGAERGSWSPLDDRWGPHGGRLYVTCLSLYMLEVYYRHLPLYAHQVKF